MHRVCCCQCECPETLTLEIRGSLPIDVACPSNVPTSPPFGSIGPYWNCVGSIDDQMETINIAEQGIGENRPCYFAQFARWCAPAGGSPSWPLIQDWALNVSRNLCAGFPSGSSPCGTKFGAPPLPSIGAANGHASLEYFSGYDAVNSRHLISLIVLVPTYLDSATWLWSTINVRAFKQSGSRRCFPRGKYSLFNTTNANTHGWVETHITSFNNTTAQPVYTTTLRSIATPPFEIWVT